jgi:RNA polymerase sigma-70 factor (ECF subfamily)
MATSAPDDESADALQGSGAEVVATLLENHRRFLDFLTARVGDRALAEEILQDAFVRGIERADAVRTNESAVAWFFRLLRNAVIDHQRRAASPIRSAGELLPELDRAAEDPANTTDVCRCILGLAGTLKPEYADALQRVDVEGRSVQDYAAEVGITANNASVRLFRAREALKRRVHATCRTCATHGCLDCTCGHTCA